MTTTLPHNWIHLDLDSRFRAMRQPEDPFIPASVSSTRTDSAAGR
jgi:hypothetical protein